MKKPSRILKRFFSHDKGVALIEFAIVFPFFFLLVFGGIEITRLILIQQKLEKAGYVLADIVTQYNPATSQANIVGELNEDEMIINVFPQLHRIMNPYGDTAREAAIVSSIFVANGMVVKWQIPGAGTLTACAGESVQSIVNGKTPAQMPVATDSPTTFPLEEATILQGYNQFTGNRNFIVSEVFYCYQPILQTLLQSVGTAGGTGFAGFDFYIPSKLYIKRTYFLPRKAYLLHLPPNYVQGI